MDNVAELNSIEISIEEDDVYQYLKPFLYRHFDRDLEANKRRVYYYGEDENEPPTYKEAEFEWYLTYNYYTYDSIRRIIRDIQETMEVLSSGGENEYTGKLGLKKGTDNHDEIELVIDFYRRLIYRLEYMMNIGKENGFDLISVMGP